MHYSRQYLATLLRLLAIVVIMATVAGCTTNSLVIRYFYSRMDNSLNTRILAMAEFSEAQKEEIRQAVDAYSAWHRQNELPRYAEFIGVLQERVETGQFDHQIVLEDLETVRDFAKEGFLQSPFVQYTEFMKSLNDSQVEQVAAHFEKGNEAFLEWLEKQKTVDRNQRRLKSIVKNTRRFGINLSEEQQQIIAAGLGRYDNDPMERHLLWNKWEQELVVLLQNRSQPDFESKLTRHLQQYQDQMRIHNPKRDLHNRKVSAQIIHDVVHNLDDRQKRILVAKLDETRRILLRMSST